MKFRCGSATVNDELPAFATAPIVSGREGVGQRLSREPGDLPERLSDRFPPREQLFVPAHAVRLL